MTYTSIRKKRQFGNGNSEAYYSSDSDNSEGLRKLNKELLLRNAELVKRLKLMKAERDKYQQMFRDWKKINKNATEAIHSLKKEKTLLTQEIQALQQLHKANMEYKQKHKAKRKIKSPHKKAKTKSKSKPKQKQKQKQKPDRIYSDESQGEGEGGEAEAAAAEAEAEAESKDSKQERVDKNTKSESKRIRSLTVDNNVLKFNYQQKENEMKQLLIEFGRLFNFVTENYSQYIEMGNDAMMDVDNNGSGSGGGSGGGSGSGNDAKNKNKNQNGNEKKQVSRYQKFKNRKKRNRIRNKKKQLQQKQKHQNSVSLYDMGPITHQILNDAQGNNLRRSSIDDNSQDVEAEADADVEEEEEEEEEEEDAVVEDEVDMDADADADSGDGDGDGDGAEDDSSSSSEGDTYNPEPAVLQFDGSNALLKPKRAHSVPSRLFRNQNPHLQQYQYRAVQLNMQPMLWKKRDSLQGRKRLPRMNAIPSSTGNTPLTTPSHSYRGKFSDDDDIEFEEDPHQILEMLGNHNPAANTTSNNSSQNTQLQSQSQSKAQQSMAPLPPNRSRMTDESAIQDIFSILNGTAAAANNGRSSASHLMMEADYAFADELGLGAAQQKSERERERGNVMNEDAYLVPLADSDNDSDSDSSS